MTRTPTASATAKGFFAGLLAVMLALRVLASAGLMPTLEQGRVTIVPCPDAGDEAPLAISAHHHHHGNAGHDHSLCPYAAASWLSFIDSDFISFAAAAPAGAALAAAVSMLVRVPQSRHLRPYLRGPPLSA